MTPAMPKVDLAPHDRAEVARILQAQVPELEVWAFGSRVKGTAKPYSDLDLALITAHPLSLERSGALREAFDESDLPIRVDLVDWATTSASFRKIIEQNKVVIQAGKGAEA